MKKNIIIFLLIIVIIIEAFIIIINNGKSYQTIYDMQVTIDNLNTKIEYLNTKIEYLNTKQIIPEIKHITNLNESIQIHNDLNLNISSFIINTDNNSITLNMDFNSNKEIQSISYNLLIYDKNINIIGEYANLFRIDQINKLFQDNNIKYNDNKILTNTLKHNIDSKELNIYKTSYTGTFNLSDSLDLSQITLRLSDIKISLYSGEEYNLVDTIYDINLIQ